jgi:hypothetical protein
MSVCKNCKYYNSCGEPTREMVCNGYEEKTDRVEIDSKEVFQYFTDLITEKETWNGDEEQNKTMHSFISGALTFCTTFGILTDDEKLELECLEIPTETDDDAEDDVDFDCPHDDCMYCEHQSKCYPNGIGEDDCFYCEGFLVSDPMDV